MYCMSLLEGSRRFYATETSVKDVLYLPSKPKALERATSGIHETVQDSKWSV